MNKSPNSLYSWEGHELNFEPRIWALLGILADEIYEGSRSRAANSIVLFSAIHFFNERARGRKPSHWLTAAAMKDGAQLESLLRTIEKVAATSQPEDIGNWWQHELERKLQGHTCPHCGEPVAGAAEKKAAKSPPGKVKGGKAAKGGKGGTPPAKMGKRRAANRPAGSKKVAGE